MVSSQSSLINFKVDFIAVNATLSYTPQHVDIDHRHSCLKSSHRIVDRCGRYCTNGLLKVLHKKDSMEVRSSDEGAMQSALDIWPTFVVMFYLTIARHLPHIAMELHSSETTVSAFKL
jgi:hypothetical protein